MALVDGLVVIVSALFLGMSIRKHDTFFSFAWAILLVVSFYLFLWKELGHG